MELNESLYTAVLQALGVQEPSSAADQKQHESRRAVRLETDFELEITPHGTARPSPRKVRIRSISRTGLAIMDSLAMQAGDKFVISLPRPDGTTVPVVCTARNSRWAGERFRTGAEFTSNVETRGRAFSVGARGIEKTSEEMSSLADPLAIQHRPDRIECNTAATMWAMGSEAEEGTIVRVADCSKNGLSIVHEQPMSAGDKFLLKAPMRGGVCNLFCTVVNCRQIGPDLYRIGTTFVEGPAAGLFHRLRYWLFRKSA